MKGIKDETKLIKARIIIGCCSLSDNNPERVQILNLGISIANTKIRV